MRPVTITAIVCAYNESRLLPACLFSLLAQTRPPDEIIVVDNASTDETGAVARAIPGVRVIDEPRKGLVVARETARRVATGDVLAYVDADCRVPLQWLERVERRFEARDGLVGVTGPVSLLRLGLERPCADSRLRHARRAADARARPPRARDRRDSLRRQLRRAARCAGAHRRVRLPHRVSRRRHESRAAG